MTDCSLFKDCRDQAEITDDYGSMNSRWQNTNFCNEENRQYEMKGSGK